MLKSEIETLFVQYLLRNPLPEEYLRFKSYSKEELEKELEVCPERIRLRKMPRVAILVSGHPRTLKIIESIKKIDNSNVDVFAFCWDEWGHRMKETKLNDSLDRDNIESIIKEIPNLKKYRIENNEKFVKNNDDLTIKYINWIRDAEVFVKSQLYAVAKSYELMEEYIKETGTRYQIVIKCRFENYIDKFDVDNEMIDDINNHKIIYVPNGTSHRHPFPSYCDKCQRIYELGYKITHIFEHDNPICDVYAYGSVESMKDYCSLFYQYDELCKKFEDHNMKMMEILKSPHTKRGEAFIVEQTDETHDETEFFYFSSYPERLLAYTLSDYLLLRANRITLGWKP